MNLEEITCPKVIIRHTLVKMEMVFKVLCVEELWSQHEAAGQGQLVYLYDFCFRFGYMVQCSCRWQSEGEGCVRGFCVQVCVFVPMHLSRWQTPFCLRHGQRNQIAFKSDTRVKTHHWAEKQNKTEMHQEPISCLIKTLQPGTSLEWGLGTGSTRCTG